jgi:hypothetical protein
MKSSEVADSRLHKEVRLDSLDHSRGRILTVEGLTTPNVRNRTLAI